MRYLAELRLLSWGPCDQLYHQDMFIYYQRVFFSQVRCKVCFEWSVIGNDCNSCLYYELHALVFDLFMNILELGVHLAAHVTGFHLGFSSRGANMTIAELRGGGQRL